MEEQAEQLAELQAQVQALTEEAARRDGAVAEAQAAGSQGELSAALVPLVGPGVEITLDDAVQTAEGNRPAGARPDDLVIHQSDVQAVVNAVWAAGADGVAIMGRRLIATSAVRCVGNTLLLQGRTYSPPFVITAIVDADATRGELAASPQVAILQQAVADFGLTFAVRGPARGGTARLRWSPGHGVRDRRLTGARRNRSPCARAGPLERRADDRR